MLWNALLSCEKMASVLGRFGSVLASVWGAFFFEIMHEQWFTTATESRILKETAVNISMRNVGTADMDWIARRNPHFFS